MISAKLSAVVALAFTLSLSACSKSERNNTTEEVTNLLSKYSESISNYPKTLDIQSIFGIYDPAATIFLNGVEIDNNASKLEFEKLKEEINLGGKIGLSSRISNINIQELSDNYVMALYDSEIKLGTAGIIDSEVKQKCTVLLEKNKQSWLVTHEHCSYKEATEKEGSSS